MDGYVKVPLNKLICEIGEDNVKTILSVFSCPLNLDIETFLKQKAIEFEKNGFSATHLVFTSFKSATVLIGYYTLSTKAFNVTKASVSKTLSKRLNKFATFDSGLKSYFLPAPLIAQLGKNFTNNYNKLISGNELLAIAIDDVKLIHQIAGGKIVYLECEDKPRLVEFYSRNGFVPFANRTLDRDETNISGEYLVQMLKYIK